MMFEKDIVCRAALYPKFVKDGVFDAEALIVFGALPDQVTWALSVASQLIAGGTDGVHKYGLVAEEKANERIREANLRNPDKANEEVHYLGHYDLEYGQIVSIGMDYYNVACRWVPLPDRDCHFHVEFQEKVGLAETPKKRKRDDRIAAIGIMAGFLTGPQRFPVPTNVARREALLKVELPELPRPVGR